MNFEQYFRDRGEFVRSVLGDSTEDRPLAVGWRSFAAGVGMLLAAFGLQLWAAAAQTDPGYFARTTTFLLVGMAGGLGLLTLALLADYRLTRFAVSVRATLKERVIRQVLRVDGIVARQLAPARQDSTHA
jgi:Na+/melibiose symporter-like transporter